MGLKFNPTHFQTSQLIIMSGQNPNVVKNGLIIISALCSTLKPSLCTWPKSADQKPILCVLQQQKFEVGDRPSITSFHCFFLLYLVQLDSAILSINTASNRVQIEENQDSFICVYLREFSSDLIGQTENRPTEILLGTM